MKTEGHRNLYIKNLLQFYNICFSLSKLEPFMKQPFMGINKIFLGRTISYILRLLRPQLFLYFTEYMIKFIKKNEMCVIIQVYCV